MSININYEIKTIVKMPRKDNSTYSKRRRGKDKKKEKHKKFGKMTGKATRSKIDRIVSLVSHKNSKKNS